MKLVSDTHTQRQKTKDGTIVMIPPGEPFDCPDEAAKEKVDAGRARRVSSGSGSASAPSAAPKGEANRKAE